MKAIIHLIIFIGFGILLLGLTACTRLKSHSTTGYTQITINGDSTKSSEVFIPKGLKVTISSSPSIANLTQTYTITQQNTTEYSRTLGGAILTGTYTLTAVMTGGYDGTTTCQFDNNSITTSQKQDFPADQATTVDFTVTCQKNSTTLHLKATNTTDPIQVNLAQLATTHINLNQQNGYQHTVRTPSTTIQHMTVTPSIDSHDHVAHYPSMLSAEQKAVTITYRPTQHKLIAIAPLSISDPDLNSLQAQHYNVIEWHGYDTVKSNVSTMTNWHNQLGTISAQSYLLISDCDPINQLPFTHGYILNVNAISSKLTHYLLQLHESLPDAKLALNIPADARVTGSQLTRLMNLHYGVSWLQIPAPSQLTSNRDLYSQLQDYGITANQLVIDMHHSSKECHLASNKKSCFKNIIDTYQSVKTGGIVIQPNQISNNNLLRHVIFLPSLP